MIPEWVMMAFEKDYKAYKKKYGKYKEKMKANSPDRFQDIKDFEKNGEL
jgi:hypothetical protein